MIADSALDVAAASSASLSDMTTVKAALPLKTCCQFLQLRRGRRRLFVFTSEGRGSVASTKAQN
jgi:hypothetical protein